MLSYAKEVFVQIKISSNRNNITLNIKLFKGVKDIAAVAEEVLDVVASWMI